MYSSASIVSQGSAAAVNGYVYPLAINHAKVGSSDHTNLTIPVYGVFPFLKDVAHGGLVKNSNGHEIRLWSDSARTTPIKFERVKYDSTTGLFLAYTKAPAASHTTNSLIQIGCGDATFTSDVSDAANSWDSNYLLVSHLPDGTSLSALDSTANANNGSILNITALNTILEGGAFCNGYTSAGRVRFGSGSGSTWNQSAFTLELWGYYDALNMAAFAKTVLAFYGSYAFSGAWGVYFDTSGVLNYVVGTDSDFLVQSSALNVSQKYHIMLSFDGATLSAYLDGSLVGTSTGHSYTPGADAANFLYMGRSRFGSPNEGYLTGGVGEMRFSKIARSADYAIAQHNAQSDPSTFLSVGTPITY